MITDINLLDFSKKYSYKDYLTWSFKERLELLAGKIFKMSPAPSSMHQKVSMRLIRSFLPIFDNEKCQLFHAPFDVRLLDSDKSTEDDNIYTVVQPDICVICDNAKIDEKGCVGAPDLIVEILSPGNTQKEMKHKFDLYEAAQVQEYWLVEPNDKVVLVYTLKNGKYIGLKPFTEGSVLKSELFPDLEVHVSSLFTN
ncbi:Endonuclease, Uma2 family (restriction endonuclease fold) [Spirosomataceae bacterium TFI 002]|nr:Endonuclease, Uma2 family (restriction endonuclease fold) [Spirosomataceae bacterium TFI 002]